MQRTHTPTTRPHILTGAALLTGLILAACAAQPAADPFTVADVFATPGKALATLEMTPTPPPTATIPNFPTSTPGPTLPLPTAILFGQPTMPLGPVGATPTRDLSLVATLTRAPCPRPPMPFTIAWDRVPSAEALLGCYTGTVQTVPAVYQSYERGAMIWIAANSDIYVMNEGAIMQGQGSDTWWRFYDLNTAGQPDDDPAITPPEGLIEPVRGFGYVWRTNAFVRDALGWATMYETPFDSLWLEFENGWMMTGLNGGAGSPIYILVPLDNPPHATGLHFGGIQP